MRFAPPRHIARRVAPLAGAERRRAAHDILGRQRPLGAQVEHDEVLPGRFGESFSFPLIGRLDLVVQRLGGGFPFALRQVGEQPFHVRIGLLEATILPSKCFARHYSREPDDITTSSTGKELPKTDSLLKCFSAHARFGPNVRKVYRLFGNAGQRGKYKCQETR